MPEPPIMGDDDGNELIRRGPVPKPNAASSGSHRVVPSKGSGRGAGKAVAKPGPPVPVPVPLPPHLESPVRRPVI